MSKNSGKSEGTDHNICNNEKKQSDSLRKFYWNCSYSLEIKTFYHQFGTFIFEIVALILQILLFFYGEGEIKVNVAKLKNIVNC